MALANSAPHPSERAVDANTSQVRAALGASKMGPQGRSLSLRGVTSTSAGLGKDERDPEAWTRAVDRTRTFVQF